MYAAKLVGTRREAIVIASGSPFVAKPAEVAEREDIAANLASAFIPSLLAAITAALLGPVFVGTVGAEVFIFLRSSRLLGISLPSAKKGLIPAFCAIGKNCLALSSDLIPPKAISPAPEVAALAISMPNSKGAIDFRCSAVKGLSLKPRSSAFISSPKRPFLNGLTSFSPSGAASPPSASMMLPFTSLTTLLDATSRIVCAAAASNVPKLISLVFLLPRPVSSPIISDGYSIEVV